MTLEEYIASIGAIEVPGQGWFYLNHNANDGLGAYEPLLSPSGQWTDPQTMLDTKNRAAELSGNGLTGWSQGSGVPAGGNYEEPNGVWSWTGEGAAPTATAGSRLVDPAYAGTGLTGRIEGNTMNNWSSPSGATGQMVMTPNGPMFQLPADAVFSTRQVDDNSGDLMGKLIQSGTMAMIGSGIASGFDVGPFAGGSYGALPGTEAAANLTADPLGSLIQGNASNWGVSSAGLGTIPTLTEQLIGQGVQSYPVSGQSVLNTNVGGTGMTAAELEAAGAASGGISSTAAGGAGSIGTAGGIAGTGLTAAELEAAGAGAGGVSSTAAGGAGSIGALTPAYAGTGLAKLLGITGEYAGAVDALGRALPGLIGAYAASGTADSQNELAQQMLEFGAPSRARYEASMTSGFDPTTIPGYQGAVDNSMQTMLRKLSTQGNPFGNPGGMIEANKSVVAGTALPALQNYQNQNSTSGGLGTLAASAGSAQQNAITANNNIYTQLGMGAAKALNPEQNMSMADMLRMFRGGFVMP